MKAWVAACKSSGPAAKLVFPKGTYLTGPVTFAGPCTVSEITVEVQGTIKATTDVSDYSSPEWFSFESIDGLRLYGTGGGFNGQGEASWKYNDCHDNSQCQLLATVSMKIPFTCS
jgi:galacturan 1,4-alpha-galacturonidase